MRQLFPVMADVDVYDAYRPPDPHAPLIRLVMITSLDGSATDPTGRSGGLGGPGDRTIFRTLRALADGILVGAGTARVEGYGPHRLTRELAQRRQAEGRPAPAPIVLVTSSLELDFSRPLFTQAVTPTIIVAPASAPAERRATAERAGVLVIAGEEVVDLRLAVTLLRERFGLAQLVCEGGPLLGATLLREGLLNELCLTIAPLVIGGGVRMLRGPRPETHFRLATLLTDGAELYARYEVRSEQA